MKKKLFAGLAATAVAAGAYTGAATLASAADEDAPFYIGASTVNIEGKSAAGQEVEFRSNASQTIAKDTDTLSAWDAALVLADGETVNGCDTRAMKKRPQVSFDGGLTVVNPVAETSTYALTAAGDYTVSVRVNVPECSFSTPWKTYPSSAFAVVGTPNPNGPTDLPSEPTDPDNPSTPDDPDTPSTPSTPSTPPTPNAPSAPGTGVEVPGLDNAGDEPWVDTDEDETGTDLAAGDGNGDGKAGTKPINNGAGNEGTTATSTDDPAYRVEAGSAIMAEATGSSTGILAGAFGSLLMLAMGAAMALRKKIARI